MWTRVDTVFFMSLIALLILLSSCVWRSSCESARVINNTYGTQYTCVDMLWSGETIRVVVVGEGLRGAIDERD
jgi:hypothetical protein